jgi:hypothetical protein
VYLYDSIVKAGKTLRASCLLVSTDVGIPCASNGPEVAIERLLEIWGWGSI